MLEREINCCVPDNMSLIHAFVGEPSNVMWRRVNGRSSMVTEMLILFTKIGGVTLQVLEVLLHICVGFVVVSYPWICFDQ